MENERISDKSLERVGRYLDGEKIRLTAEEHVLAAEIDCDQRLVGKALDQTPVPQGLFQRLPQQPKVRLVGARLRPVRLTILSMAAAAAVLVMALGFWHLHLTTVPQGPGVQVVSNPLHELIAPGGGEASEADSMEDLLTIMATSDDELNTAGDVDPVIAPLGN